MARKLKLVLTIVLVLTAFSVNKAGAQAAPDEILAICPKISLMYDGLYSSNSSFLGTNAACDTLPSGYGIGGALGVFVERKLFSSAFVGLGISYVNRSGKLMKDTDYPMRDTVTGLTPNVTIRDVIDLKTSFIEFQPEFRYVLSERFINGPLRAGLGFRIALPLSPSFEQYREVKSPEDFYFENSGSRVKKLPIAAGDVTTASSTLYGLSFGLENLLKIGNNSHLTQQLSFDYNFNSLTTDADIKHFAVRLDFGLRFGFLESEKEPEPPAPVKQEPKPEPSVRKPELVVEDLKFDGRILTGEEILASLPIVNAVFFAENSSELPPKYSLKPSTSRNWFSGDPVLTHKEALARIAQIVSENPSAQITLEGATAGPALEPEGVALARKRAESVRDALISLGVPASKISIKALITPVNPSNQEFPEGVEENRRVDILLKNAPLQEYVAFSQFSQLTGELSARLLANNIEDLSRIKIGTNASQKLIPYSESVAIPVDRRLAVGESTAEFYVSMDYDAASARKSIAVNLNSLGRENVERNLSNFNAVLHFSYNSSELTEENKGLLEQLAKSLPEGSTIEILGSADALGSQERNATLSRERAQATESYIKSISGNKFRFETGVNPHKFDESTPEGRFLSRSIGIRVK